MKSAIIREVKKSDLTSLIALCTQHAEFEQAAYDVQGKKEQMADVLFSEDKKIAAQSLQILVVELHGEIIGYASYIKQFSTWDLEHYLYLDCMFLNDKSRGMGLGKQLIERVKEQALRLNCRIIQWQTPEFNHRAIKFYHAIGAVSKAKQRFFLSAE